jgi:hypothetical protein
MRPTRLKNLKISEVSSVDRGAGESCEIVLSKRHDAMTDIDRGFAALTESVASIIGDDTLVEKGDALNETMAQAQDYFEKVVAGPGDGADLLHDNERPDADDDTDSVPAKRTAYGDGAYGALMAKAEALRKADPKLTEAQAFTKVHRSGQPQSRRCGTHRAAHGRAHRLAEQTR